MTRFLRNILEGIGSVMDISPASSYRKYKDLSSDPNRDAMNLRSDWEKVGSALSRAMGEAIHGEEHKAKSS